MPQILHVNADDLILWKVSVLVNHSFKDTISKLNLDDEHSLSPMAKLSKVFADAPEEMHLHIVVRVPAAGGEC
jgi:Crinkler effector protein N-terminal domain